MTYTTVYESPIGFLELISDGMSLTDLRFKETETIQTEQTTKVLESSLSIFTDTKQWLDIYFTGKDPDFTLPLSLCGTSFQKEVWNILLQIPYGSTLTYGDIAKELAKTRGIAQMSAQAVGNAIEKNPIPIIVPCHRVIGSDGSLTGYSGGIEKKKYLLAIENITYKNSAGN